MKKQKNRKAVEKERRIYSVGIILNMMLATFAFAFLLSLVYAGEVSGAVQLGDFRTVSLPGVGSIEEQWDGSQWIRTGEQQAWEKLSAASIKQTAEQVAAMKAKQGLTNANVPTGNAVQ